ncbi:hypothetical protein SRHO_G00249530 [Serrasalmus rhombeus]
MLRHHIRHISLSEKGRPGMPLSLLHLHPLAASRSFSDRRSDLISFNSDSGAGGDRRDNGRWCWSKVCCPTTKPTRLNNLDIGRFLLGNLFLLFLSLFLISTCNTEFLQEQLIQAKLDKEDAVSCWRGKLCRWSEHGLTAGLEFPQQSCGVCVRHRPAVQEILEKYI